MNTIGDIKNLVAAYLKNDTGKFIQNDVDLLLMAINNARRIAERLHDFKYSEDPVSLSISSSGGDISSLSIKRVQRVLLPIAGGDYIPIEFMTNDEWLGRLRRQTGRTAYTPSQTLTQYGVSASNPVCYQQGQKLFLAPASQFTLPITVQLDAIKFQPDYTADTDTDFFVQYAPEYLQWKAIVEGNKYWKEFVSLRQEGNVEEPTQFADEALQSLLTWDQSLSLSTSTPQRNGST
jgi:hypothetical protein